MTQNYSCSRLSDNMLLAEVKQCVGKERHAQAVFLARLAELDRRRLYAKLGFPSTFAYCTQELGFAEGSACKRIQVARTARKYPLIYSFIEAGKIHMEAVSLLSPLLTQENHEELLAKACEKTKQEVAQIVACLASKPDVPDSVRKLSRRRITFAGECAEIGTENAGSVPEPLNLLSPRPTRRDQVAPLSEDRVKIQFTGSEQLQKKLVRAKEVLRHTFPNGRLEDVIEAALDALLDKKDPERKLVRKMGRKKKSGGAKATTAQTRRIPQAVKDVVWRRDHGRCSYVSPGGRRCVEKGGLEYDHVIPWALGGPSNDPNNVRLLCHGHNQWAARQVFEHLNFVH